MPQKTIQQVIFENDQKLQQQEQKLYAKQMLGLI